MSASPPPYRYPRSALRLEENEASVRTRRSRAPSGRRVALVIHTVSANYAQPSKWGVDRHAVFLFVSSSANSFNHGSVNTLCRLLSHMLFGTLYVYFVGIHGRILQWQGGSRCDLLPRSEGGERVVGEVGFPGALGSWMASRTSMREATGEKGDSRGSSPPTNLQDAREAAYRATVAIGVDHPLQCALHGITVARILPPKLGG